MFFPDDDDAAQVAPPWDDSAVDNSLDWEVDHTVNADAFSSAIPAAPPVPPTTMKVLKSAPPAPTVAPTKKSLAAAIKSRLRLGSADVKPKDDEKKVPERMSVEALSELFCNTLKALGSISQLGADQMTLQHRTDARQVLTTIYHNLPPGDKAKMVAPSGKVEIHKECQVCFSAFSSDTRKQLMTHCGHGMICSDCFTTYISTHINDDDVMPWIVCPNPDCKVPLHPSDIAATGVSPLDLYRMAATHLTKTLAQHEDWVSCKNDSYKKSPMAIFGKAAKKLQCPFGFVMLEAGKKTLSCGVCSKKQSVEKKPVELDAGFKDMIKKGVMRDCPKCHFYTTKDYGICNVIQCAKCAIWWNWRSKETGSSYKALKDKARSLGTLWEPGELAFQQKLEQSDPKAFAELLERNGQKYDPNYRRGAD